LKKKIKDIVIIGSGNVASILGNEFLKKKIKVLQVYSRTEAHAKKLASKLNCNYTSDVDQIEPSADLYLFTVSDSAIQSILKQGNWQGKTLAHTAGSVPLEIFKPFSENYGVFYPFQSFTKERKIDLSETPFFIEGSNEQVTIQLQNLAQHISSKVEVASSQQRAILHLAGVFVSNFTNHMVTIAFNILKENNLPKESIYPLLKETVEKAIDINPEKAQTGPAIRNNKEILDKQVQMLQENPEWQKIYTFVSESINKFHNNG
jgi:predicted short-subunit dehydrogenase-like oxidoreductase (DUF2520 family)